MLTGAGVIHHCPCCSVGQAIKLAAAAKRAMDDAEEELLSKRPKFSDSTQKRNFSGTSASFNNSGLCFKHLQPFTWHAQYILHPAVPERSKRDCDDQFDHVYLFGFKKWDQSLITIVLAM